MTRINTIDPTLLTNQWLAAEYRELPRVLNAVARNLGEDVKVEAQVPPTYRMGQGHVTFFVDKLLYLYKRHQVLSAEMVFRAATTGRKLELSIDCLEVYTQIAAKRPDLCKDWTPTADDHFTNLARLCERWNDAKRPPRLNAQVMSSEADAINWVTTVAIKHKLYPARALQLMLNSLRAAGRITTLEQ